MPEPVFSYVLCKNTGEPIDELRELVSRQIVHQLNVPMGVTVGVRMDSPIYAQAAVDLQPRLKVYRQATAAEIAANPAATRTLIFYGLLNEDGLREDARSGVGVLPFQDPSWTFNDRVTQAAVSYTAVDQGTILWNLIALQNARTNGNTFVSAGTITTGTLRDRAYEAGKNLGTLIDEMTRVDGGPDVGILPVDGWLSGTTTMGSFNTWAQRGSIKNEARLVFADPQLASQPDALPSNVENVMRSRVKVVTMATAVNPQLGLLRNYQEILSPYGLRETWETFNDISYHPTLYEKAVGRVLERRFPRSVIEVQNPTNEAPQPFVDYNVGDSVFVTCLRANMEFVNTQVRVMSISLDTDANGKVNDQLTLVSP